jgi:hypothetical protein
MESCKCLPIYIARCNIRLDSEVHQSLYFPGDDTPVYRASLEGKTLIIESVKELTEMQITETAKAFGIGIAHWNADDVKKYTQKNGKLLPVDDVLRRKAIMELSDKFSIYSFGRFAIWKPIRADHLISDIEKINKMISISEVDKKYSIKKGGNKYEG